MPVKKAITEKDGIYFITFTCCAWMPLFELTNSYDAVYRWFDSLKVKNHHLLGYVIMPNHIHALIAFRNSGSSINTIVSNGKRFMAYELVKRLEQKNENQILHKLSLAVTGSDKKRGKIHQVFEESFDWKECRTDRFIEQKLYYIHNNPCKGKWDLAASPVEYLHSSARFYITGVQGVYEVTNYGFLKDISLTNEKVGIKLNEAVSPLTRKDSQGRHGLQ
jgi:REP element-mobilizing transposase RayT